MGSCLEILQLLLGECGVGGAGGGGSRSEGRGDVLERVAVHLNMRNKRSGAGLGETLAGLVLKYRTLGNM